MDWDGGGVNKMDTKKSDEFEEDALSAKQKAFLAIFEENLGIVTASCAQAQISRAGFYKWKQENEEFSKAVDEIEAVTLDFVESKLHARIQDEDTTAIIFYLKCKGKKRGYTEKTEVEHSGHITLEVKASELSDDHLATIAAGGSA
jgi:hypothetical protein